MGMALTVPHYTAEDLEHFPHDGNRYELLDGALLVTPAPSNLHQVLATRLVLVIGAAVEKLGLATIVGPGVITRLPLTHLEPDVLVYPSRFSPGSRWEDIDEHWLAVEILSRSSRVYDREFKRDAYFALGVREVWLIDQHEQTIERCRRRGPGDVEQGALTWRVPDTDVDVLIDILELFRGAA